MSAWGQPADADEKVESLLGATGQLQTHATQLEATIERFVAKATRQTNATLKNLEATPNSFEEAFKRAKEAHERTEAARIDLKKARERDEASREAPGENALKLAEEQLKDADVEMILALAAEARAQSQMAHLAAIQFKEDLSERGLVINEAEKLAVAVEGAVKGAQGAADDLARSFVGSDAERKEIEQLRNNVVSAADNVKSAMGKLRTSLDIEKQPAKDAKRAIVGTPIQSPARGDYFGKYSVDALRIKTQEYFQRATGSKIPPRNLELRNFLFAYLRQVNVTLETRQIYSNTAFAIVEAAKLIEGGYDVKSMRRNWLEEIADKDRGTSPQTAEKDFGSVAWLVAVQSGILDRNLKRILREMKLEHKISPEEEALVEVVEFFNPQLEPDGAVRLWQTIIQQEFPLHVFTLDPQVEEQNVYDAFSRRRELQVAIAFAVASGQMDARQSLAMSRQLALDMSAIGLNRTAVAFSHGSDTFGWYFYPRVQSPPTETSNLVAFGRTLWSTGPTERYELRHRKMEPGMRECEVLVAMPSFVTNVSFDVTTNWEKLARPGVTKRSYEEMVAQGGRLQRLRWNLDRVSDHHCYRPGDYARLISRVDQLELMLGMQTYLVNVPYEYELAGTELFSTGDVHLRPVLHDYYGLDFAEAGGETACVFLTGRNFHPTLTHVIIGGRESHNLPTDNGKEVEVISRELLRVKFSKLNLKLSNDNRFTVRVGTPAGVSQPLTIGVKPPATPPATPPSDFDWATAPTYTAQIGYDRTVVFSIDGVEQEDTLVIKNNKGLPLPVGDILPDMKPGGLLVLALTATFKDGSTRPLGQITDIAALPDGKGGLKVQFGGDDGLAKKIERTIIGGIARTDEPVSFTGIAYLKFDQWPFIRFATPLIITIEPTRLPTKKRGTDGGLMFRLPPAEEIGYRPSGNTIGFAQPVGQASATRTHDSSIR